MRQEIFELPSTATIEFRQVKLAEENLLSAASKSRRGNVNKTLSAIMTKCTVGVVDPGPYSFLEPGGVPDWDKMARGDRFASMLNLRCISYREGHLYEAELRCPSSMCGHKFDWEVNIAEDLIRQQMPASSVEKLKNGEPFEVIIAGKKVMYAIALGKTEDTYDRLCMQYPGRDMAAAMRARIIGVDGVKPSEIMDWLDGGNDASDCKYSGLTSDDAEDMRDAFDRVDGGVDTTLEAECPKCRAWFEFDLPFSGIFLPGKGISKRRKELRRKDKEAKLSKQMEQVTVEKPVGEQVTVDGQDQDGGLEK